MTERVPRTGGQSDEAVREFARDLLDHGVQHLSDREKRLISRLAAKAHIARDVGREYEEAQSLGDRAADRLAAIGGSWSFIVGFGVALVAWVTINSIAVLFQPFDPYPFIFLNLILSMLAAIQAPIIMMSQNRQAEKDRLAAAHDYEINLKAELEIMALHDKLDRLRSDQLGELLRTQQAQLDMLATLVAARPA